MQKKLLAVLFLCLALVTAGCDAPGGKTLPANPPTQEDKAPKPEEQKKEEPKEITVRLYYPNDDATKLVATERKIELNGKNRYEAAIEALMTSGQGRYTVIPKQTKLLGVTLKNGTARVDFSGDLQKYFVGGSTGEEMLVGSVVDTLTEFPEVKAVEFFIDGKRAETIAGHSDLSVPVKRMEELLK